VRILIDVTSAAESPMNTGIQRVVRGVTQEMARQHSITAVLWDEKLGAYRGLTRSETIHLQEPWKSWQHRLPPTIRRPVVNWLEKGLIREKRAKCREVSAWLVEADAFLMPEVFRDGRIEALEAARRESPIPWTSFFYDATPLKLAEVTDPARRASIDRYHAALAMFDLVVAASAETRDDIESLWDQLGIVPSKTAILAWPIPFPLPPPVSQPNFAARRFLYVATLEGRKNHLVLLEAAERLWEAGEAFTLELIGRATKHWGPKVMPEIRRLQRKGRGLIYRGRVDDVALREAYERCSATVYPSLMEGYGIPILESLYFGRPCLCSAEGAIGEVSLGGGCLHTEVAQEEALADAMKQLLEDEPLYDRLHQECRARTFPSWPGFCQELESRLSRPA